MAQKVNIWTVYIYYISYKIIDIQVEIYTYIQLNMFFLMYSFLDLSFFHLKEGTEPKKENFRNSSFQLESK